MAKLSENIRPNAYCLLLYIINSERNICSGTIKRKHNPFSTMCLDKAFYECFIENFGEIKASWLSKMSCWPLLPAWNADDQIFPFMSLLTFWYASCGLPNNKKALFCCLKSQFAFSLFLLINMMKWFILKTLLHPLLLPSSWPQGKGKEELRFFTCIQFLFLQLNGLEQILAWHPGSTNSSISNDNELFAFALACQMFIRISCNLSLS